MVSFALARTRQLHAQDGCFRLEVTRDERHPKLMRERGHNTSFSPLTTRSEPKLLQVMESPYARRIPSEGIGRTVRPQPEADGRHGHHSEDTSSSDAIRIPLRLACSPGEDYCRRDKTLRIGRRIR